MLHASVHELKAQLSHYLNLAQQGKMVVVTNHNRPIAQISPLEVCPNSGIEQLLATGLAKWNNKKPKGAAIKLIKKGKSVADMILDDRR